MENNSKEEKKYFKLFKNLVEYKYYDMNYSIVQDKFHKELKSELEMRDYDTVHNLIQEIHDGDGKMTPVSIDQEFYKKFEVITAKSGFAPRSFSHGNESYDVMITFYPLFNNSHHVVGSKNLQDILNGIKI
jgi:hypothetical protein